ncbi:hypothetical protein ACWEV3_10385 [Saccharopolyspora sp. NPDC003752]
MSGDRISATTAQLPAFTESDDKVFTTSNAVIVLDGASAFRPIPVSASAYATTLGGELRRSLEEQPTSDLPSLLAGAIRSTTSRLNLVAGDSPSSTVAIVRQREDAVDSLVLGDTAIIFPDEVISDERIDALNLVERRQYQERLADGYGYDEVHKRLLRELQDQQVKYRNRRGGYWIAEADPAAADHAITSVRHVRATPWAILATDGAFNTLSHMGLDNWGEVATGDEAALAMLLEQSRQWEAITDPDGQAFPRAKRHDDKAIVTIRFWNTAAQAVH